MAFLELYADFLSLPAFLVPLTPAAALGLLEMLRVASAVDGGIFLKVCWLMELW